MKATKKAVDAVAYLAIYIKIRRTAKWLGLKIAPCTPQEIKERKNKMKYLVERSGWPWARVYRHLVRLGDDPKFIK